MTDQTVCVGEYYAQNPPGINRKVWEGLREETSGRLKFCEEFDEDHLILTTLEKESREEPSFLCSVRFSKILGPATTQDTCYWGRLVHYVLTKHPGKETHSFSSMKQICEIMECDSGSPDEALSTLNRLSNTYYKWAALTEEGKPLEVSLVVNALSIGKPKKETLYFPPISLGMVCLPSKVIKQVVIECF